MPLAEIVLGIGGNGGGEVAGGDTSVVVTFLHFLLQTDFLATILPQCLDTKKQQFRAHKMAKFLGKSTTHCTGSIIFGLSECSLLVFAAVDYSKLTHQQNGSF